MMMAKKIRYSAHLEARLRFRNIPLGLPETIYKTSRNRYVDSVTGLYVAVKKVHYNRQARDMAVIYKESLEEVLLVTIHPLKPQQKLNRISKGRWQKI